MLPPSEAAQCRLLALSDRYCAATKCRLLGQKRKSPTHAKTDVGP